MVKRRPFYIPINGSLDRDITAIFEGKIEAQWVFGENLKSLQLILQQWNIHANGHIRIDIPSIKWEREVATNSDRLPRIIAPLAAVSCGRLTFNGAPKLSILKRPPNSVPKRWAPTFARVGTEKLHVMHYQHSIWGFGGFYVPRDIASNLEPFIDLF